MLDGIYACLHGPADGCACRKPRPTLMQQAARDLRSATCAASYLRGRPLYRYPDRANAGAKGILVLTGYGRGEYEYVRPEPNRCSRSRWRPISWKRWSGFWRI